VEAGGGAPTKGRRARIARRAAWFAGLFAVGLANDARAEHHFHDHDETEVGFFPVIGGTSDVGFGAGFLAALAHFKAGEDRYTWRFELGALATYKPHGGHSNVPYTDFYALVTIPQIAPGVRLDVRPSYTGETTQNYYGMGNASAVPRVTVASDYNQYGRIHPTLAAFLRFEVAPAIYLRLGNYITFNHVSVYVPSKLDQDIHSQDPEIRSLVGEPQHDHFVNIVETAFLYDTRDDETEPHYGMYHQVSLRLSPGGVSCFPYRYEQVNTTARFYVGPVHRFTLGARIVGDMQLDNPPFYELARFEDTYALGGANGVRGVPGQRYYGKIKLFGNLEGRLRLGAFQLFGRRLRFGIAAFLDAGRLWSDFGAHPDLDGTTLGLKWGIGGGMRIYQASTFAVRLDLAYSPDARPMGGYLGVNEIF
jgi:outer membrane protein assembly factor BamA